MPFPMSTAAPSCSRHGQPANERNSALKRNDIDLKAGAVTVERSWTLARERVGRR